MKRTRYLILLALAGILFTLTGTAFAQCGAGDPDCPLVPPQSREIATHPTTGALATGSGESLNSLKPLDVPPPQFVLAPGDSAADAVSPIPTFETLDLRLRRQSPGDASCGVQALGMALDGLDGAGPASGALLAYLQEQGYLFVFGTGVEELAAAAHHFGYRGAFAFHGWSFDSLKQELASGRAVVVALGANGPEQPGHFVTLTGISPDGGWVAFHDPLLGERVMSSAEFLALWDSQGLSGVAVAASAPAPSSPGYETWMTAMLAMMATLSLAPGMLSRRTRPGVGGALVDGSGSGAPLTSVALEPPYSAPAGTHWERGAAVYETVTKTLLEYEEIPNMVYKEVRVGTEYEQIPYTKTIEVDEGQWVTDYATERYVSGHRTKKVLLYYRTERYTAYYRTQRYPLPWGGYGYQQVPVYAYRQVPVYGTETVPVYSTRQVESGQHWESNRVTKEYTEYRTVEKPVYEWQWVQEGMQRVPVERQVSEQVLVGYEWTLVEDLAEEPLPVERSNMDWDPLRDNPGSNFPDKEQYLASLFSESYKPQLVQATGNMHLRAEPSAHAEHLAWIAIGDTFSYTGGTVTTNGAQWKSVVYTLNGVPTPGWVIGGYYEAVPPEEQIRTDDSLQARNATLEYYWYHLGFEERKSSMERARALIDSYLAEIRRLTSSLRPGDPLAEYLAGIADVLLQPPDWYAENDIPGEFFRRSSLTQEALGALRELMLISDQLAVQPSQETWELAAYAMGVTPGDLILQAFDDATWPVDESSSAGDYPVRFYITRKYGCWLRSTPEPDAPNVSEAFLGVPQGEQVTWNGTYHVGVDESGARCIYYQVEWEYNNHTYTGWIPGGYVAPRITYRDPYTDLIYGDWLNPTHGYGEAGGWSLFHAGGAAQNLNLRALFKSMGYPQEIYGQFPTVHHNLCGELAVMEALGVSLEEGFARFMELGQEFVGVLMDAREGTDASQLERFIKSYGDYGRTASTVTSSMSQIQKALSMNQCVLALVTIDTSDHGSLNELGDAPHWVHITSIEGEVVQYYNPYTNSIQSMSTIDFGAAWQNTPGNSSTFIAVIASQ